MEWHAEGGWGEGGHLGEEREGEVMRGKSHAGGGIMGGDLLVRCQSAAVNVGFDRVSAAVAICMHHIWARQDHTFTHQRENASRGRLHERD